MATNFKARLIWLGAIVLMAAIAASLIPANMQIRTGLHWQVEHFLVYFVATPIFCLAWPRPFIVVGVIMAFAALLEALQGLTPDRTPDLPTALAAAAGALTAGGFGLARDPRAKACPGAVKANLMYP